MKCVLVTGATGFIGYQCLAALTCLGYEVVAVTSRPQPEPFPGVRWVTLDLLNAEETVRVLAQIKPETLLHFAWYAVPGKFWTAQENLRWVQASLTLLQNFARNGGRRIVTAGTCAEYDWKTGICVENQSALAPATLYGTCKNALQEIQTAFCRQEGIRQAWGRIFLTYGPREHPDRLVSSVINALIRRKPARCSHGGQLRDFMHAQDVAEAFVALLDSDVEGPINIASGKPIAIKEVVYHIADWLGQRGLVELGALSSPTTDPALLTADTTRLVQEVGWTPRYDLTSGLDQTIQWWLARFDGEGIEGAPIV